MPYYEHSEQTMAALNPEVPVPAGFSAPFLASLLDSQEDRRLAREVGEALAQFDLERAALPPVIHVVMPGVPGHVVADLGTGERAWVT